MLLNSAISVETKKPYCAIEKGDSCSSDLDFCNENGDLQKRTQWRESEPVGSEMVIRECIEMLLTWADKDVSHAHD